MALSDISIMRDILAEVSEATGFKESLLIGRRRTASLARARQLAYYVAHRSGVSYADIGRAMHRDHSTVMFGVKAEKKRRIGGKVAPTLVSPVKPVL